MSDHTFGLKRKVCMCLCMCVCVCVCVCVCAEKAGGIFIKYLPWSLPSGIGIIVYSYFLLNTFCIF